DTSYQFDPFDRNIVQSWKNSGVTESITFGYAPDDQMTSAIDDPGTGGAKVKSNYVYSYSDPLRHLKTTTYTISDAQNPTGVSTPLTNPYDNSTSRFGDLLKTAVSFDGTSTLYSIAYGYDGLGRLLTSTQIGPFGSGFYASALFTYNAAGQLLN